MSNLHEIIFTSWSTNISKHSYTDFGVILTEQNIGLPSPKTYSVSIEGMDGSLDLSECFGEMKYENRTLKFTFESIEKITDWQAKMINISSFLHGQKMKICSWSDPDFYYIGRCQIDEYNLNQRLGKIVISCDCEPFKYKKNITTFNLTEGTNTVNNSRMTVYADLINESEITINSKVYSAGTHLRAIKLTSGANTLNSSGNATLNFQEGEI
jgi:phage-related protein